MKYTLGTSAVHLVSVHLRRLMQNSFNLEAYGRKVSEPSPGLETDTFPYFPSGHQ